jgi:hypothetical protein
MGNHWFSLEIDLYAVNKMQLSAGIAQARVSTVSMPASASLVK